MKAQDWKGLLDIYEADRKHNPPCLNILDYTNINENRHTYFLCALLKYSYAGKRPFLESFLGMLGCNCFQDLTNVRIVSQSDYIDCLITDDMSAIIIENKVCGAGDQNNQLESYIQKELNCGIAFKNIYVVYLTLAGGSPASVSIGEDRKGSLEERYIERNYNDILQWLKEDVLFACHYPEKKVIWSVELYIDKIQRMLGQDQQSIVATEVRKYLAAHSVSQYREIKELVKNCPEDGNEAIYRELLNAVLELMLQENLYLDQYRTAYELKWILRNNPGIFGKEWKGGDFAPFDNSIGNFTYCSARFVQLWAYFEGGSCRIHQQCDMEGLKKGPYCFAKDVKDYKAFWDEEFLRQNGFDLKDEGTYRYPYADFTEHTSVLDVARHIEKMIHLLNEAQARMVRP